MIWFRNQALSSKTASEGIGFNQFSSGHWSSHAVYLGLYLIEGANTTQKFHTNLDRALEDILPIWENKACHCTDETMENDKPSHHC